MPFRRSAAVLAALLSLALASAAAQQPAGRASEVIGKVALDAEGRRAGTIDDLLIGPDGRITGVVLDLGSFLGMGRRQVAVAWDKLEAARQAGAVRIALTRAQLQAAPPYRPATSRPVQSTKE